MKIDAWTRGKPPPALARRGWLRVVFGVGVAAVVIVWPLVVGSKLVAPAQRPVGAPPDDLQVEPVQLISPTGDRIRGWFSSGRPGRGAVLLLHPLRGNRSTMIPRALFLHRLGTAVLLIDQQAHGESDGNQVTFGMRESQGARAAARWLRSRLPDERLGVIGVSLGGAAALLAEPPIHPDALVLESVYPTIQDAVRDRLRMRMGGAGDLLAPGLLWQLEYRLGIPPDALRPLDRLPEVGAPVMFASGDEDRHTPIGETRAMYERAREPKELWVVVGASHEDLYAFAPREYERRVGRFLMTWLQGKSRKRCEPVR